MLAQAYALLVTLGLGLCCALLIAQVRRRDRALRAQRERAKLQERTSRARVHRARLWRRPARPAGRAATRGGGGSF